MFRAIAITMLVATTSCLAAEESVKVQQQWQEINSGIKTAKRTVITSAAEWEKTWDEVHSDRTPKPELPKLDFDKQAVVAVFMGSKPSGGYNVEITKITQTDKGLQVAVKETSPAEGDIVTGAFTSPYVLAVVAKPKGETKFVDGK